VGVSYGRAKKLTNALVDFNLRVAPGETVALLGPSGSGKSTALNALAGFVRPTSGAVWLAGRDVTDLPPAKRGIGVVLQSYALFPHMRVAENVAFGLRSHKVPGNEIDSRVSEALAMVGMGAFGKRLPRELSGGQQQRIAIARALAIRPKVLLLDEPLGALDLKLRENMQEELKLLQKSLGITFVFVTHDQEEALTMSDRVAVMNAGRVEQVDEASRLFERPRTDFVARFLGAGNFFAATVVGTGVAGGLELELDGGQRIHVAAGEGLRPDGTSVRFVVRPEKLMLRRRDDAARDVTCVGVTVEERTYHGVSTTWTVCDDAGARFTVYEQNDERFAERGELVPGERAWLCWHPRHTVLLD
ncbi:MAG TPA: ABC transporter ATP-binding protein, partial [Thermoanaerobaculia bacterium]|nr:ABC transporter ATP-binding protein [Thermoanaerobaculia bacterium]